MSIDLLERPPVTPAPVATQPVVPPPGFNLRRRHVQLQVRRHLVADVWLPVIDADIGTDAQEEFMRTGVELLCAVDPAAHFRVVMQRLGSLIVLASYSADTGWRAE